MVKELYNVSGKVLATDPGPVPDPPPRPEYNVAEEPPKWNWRRLKYGYSEIKPNPEVPRAGGLPDSEDKPDWRGVVKANVIPLEPPKEYEFGQSEWRSYYWFDTPDHADPFKKLWFSVKFFAKTGIIAALSIASIKGMSWNRANHVHLLRAYILPWWTGGMAASMTIITVANLRGKKDDYWNYFAGAMAAAGVTGRSCYIKHFNHMLYWTVGSMVAKHANETNSALFPVFNQGIRNLGFYGNSAEDGIMSGNFHWMKGSQGDPGRDTRRHPI